MCFGTVLITLPKVCPGGSVEMEVFGVLLLIDAEGARGKSLSECMKTLHEPERTVVIGPGKYEVEKVDNPFSPASAGTPWIVIKGTLRGLTYAEVMRRGMYADGCPLKIKLIEELTLFPQREQLSVETVAQPSYVHQLLARLLVANS